MAGATDRRAGAEVSRDVFPCRDSWCSQQGELRVRADGSLQIELGRIDCPGSCLPSSAQLSAKDAVALAKVILRRAMPEHTLVQTSALGHMVEMLDELMNPAAEGGQ